MTNKKMTVQFTLLTFCIAYFVSGILIILGQVGYTVHSTVQESIQHLGMNIPFAIYILSPAIAGYIVLKKNEEIAGPGEWLKAVFYAKNSFFLYLFIAAGLTLYFLIHVAVSGRTETVLPFYMFFLNLPGNLFICGLEEAGWSYILQPYLDKKYGYILSSSVVGIIWLLWHIPLFLIPGTGHYEGLIDFWMFAVNIISFRFFYGAICRIAGKGRVFLCVLFHTMFNAASPAAGILPMTWAGTIAANAAVAIVAIISVIIQGKRDKQMAHWTKRD